MAQLSEWGTEDSHSNIFTVHSPGLTRRLNNGNRFVPRSMLLKGKRD